MSSESGWPHVRARFLFREVNERSFDLPLASVTKHGGVEFRADLEASVWNPGDDTSSYKRVLPGDFVIGLRSFQSGIGYSKLEGIISPAYTVLRPLMPICDGFYRHYFKSQRFIAKLDMISQGIRQGRTIATEDFYNLSIPTPDAKTQGRIADFLDTETARIDSLVAAHHRLLSLLELRIDSEVAAWVERSPLAGSSQTALVPIRRVLKKYVRWVENISDDEIVTAFRDGIVIRRSERDRDGFTNAATESARMQMVEPGDLVVHGLDGFSGAIGDSQSSGTCSPAYHVCRPYLGDPAFLGRLLRWLALDGYLETYTTSTRERAVDFRNWDMFGRIKIPDVPVQEQVRIGNTIRAMRPLKGMIQTSQELLRERRQALITAAVTGDLEIPGVAA